MAADGKFGLALSGGGFRASYFHLGVLARLADLDLLRHVEVLSTVSGGSIVGALYYLKVKALLERKPDAEIRASDYQELVRSLITDFTRAVEKNIRLRTFVNPVASARMSFANYSRSDRIGELFDQMLYRPALDPKRREPVRMEELIITPAGWEGRFTPDRHNRSRRAKVPVLLINATSLNTGRNWRFEAIRMGEPAPRNSFASDVDVQMRLEALPNYDQMPTRHRGMLLGHAVAASAAVPGVFHPLALSRLYQGVRVELVDGGVHDNQGVVGLMDRNCTRMVVSDGSGQLEGEEHPGTAIPSVLMRMNSIVTGRVRQEQMMRAHQARGADLAFVHLRKGLPPHVVPYRAGAAGDGKYAGQEVKDGSPLMAPEVQEALSRVRTDLDTFNEIERYSLMQAGYVITKRELRSIGHAPYRAGHARARRWEFSAVAPLMSDPPPEYLKALKTASSNAFKVFSLFPSLSAASLLLLAGFAAGWMWTHREALLEPVISAAALPTRLGVLLVAVLVMFSLMPAPRRALWRIASGRMGALVRVPLRWLGRVVFRTVPWVAFAVFAWAYLVLFNPVYLRAGRLDRFEQSGSKAPSAALGAQRNAR